MSPGLPVEEASRGGVSSAGHKPQVEPAACSGLQNTGLVPSFMSPQCHVPEPEVWVACLLTPDSPLASRRSVSAEPGCPRGSWALRHLPMGTGVPGTPRRGRHAEPLLSPCKAACLSKGLLSFPSRAFLSCDFVSPARSSLLLPLLKATFHQMESNASQTSCFAFLMSDNDLMLCLSI